jgi:Lrp/AsnC family leucine-responsive transcriptional regulator
MDSIDREILRLIQQDGRLSYGDLGTEVGLSVSAVNERLKKLQAAGVLRGWVALVEPKAVGLDICAFIQVLVDRPANCGPFLAKMAEQPEILECHHVTGDFSYLLKVRARDTSQLESIMSDVIKGVRGVVRTQTLIVLSSPKETTAVEVRAI